MLLRGRRAKAEATRDEAVVALRAARAARRDQERKLEQEKEAVISRLDRIAQGNNIARLIVRRLAERIANSTLGVGHRLPTIAWGVADASGEATVDALVEAADRAMYRQKQLTRKRTPA